METLSLFFNKSNKESFDKLDINILSIIYSYFEIRFILNVMSKVNKSYNEISKNLNILSHMQINIGKIENDLYGKLKLTFNQNDQMQYIKKYYRFQCQYCFKVFYNDDSKLIKNQKLKIKNIIIRSCKYCFESILNYFTSIYNDNDNDNDQIQNINKIQITNFEKMNFEIREQSWESSSDDDSLPIQQIFRNPNYRLKLNEKLKELKDFLEQKGNLVAYQNNLRLEFQKEIIGILIDKIGMYMNHVLINQNDKSRKWIKHFHEYAELDSKSIRLLQLQEQLYPDECINLERPLLESESECLTLINKF